jgi:hypothetical protein
LIFQAFCLLGKEASQLKRKVSDEYTTSIFGVEIKKETIIKQAAPQNVCVPLLWLLDCSSAPKMAALFTSESLLDFQKNAMSYRRKQNSLFPPL